MPGARRIQPAKSAHVISPGSLQTNGLAPAPKQHPTYESAAINNPSRTSAVNRNCASWPLHRSTPQHVLDLDGAHFVRRAAHRSAIAG